MLFVWILVTFMHFSEKKCCWYSWTVHHIPATFQMFNKQDFLERASSLLRHKLLLNRFECKCYQSFLKAPKSLFSSFLHSLIHKWFIYTIIVTSKFNRNPLLIQSSLSCFSSNGFVSHNFSVDSWTFICSQVLWVLLRITPFFMLTLYPIYFFHPIIYVHYRGKWVGTIHRQSSIPVLFVILISKHKGQHWAVFDSTDFARSHWYLMDVGLSVGSVKTIEQYHEPFTSLLPRPQLARKRKHDLWGTTLHYIKHMLLAPHYTRSTAYISVGYDVVLYTKGRLFASIFGLFSIASVHTCGIKGDAGCDSKSLILRACPLYHTSHQGCIALLYVKWLNYTSFLPLSAHQSPQARSSQALLKELKLQADGGMNRLYSICVYHLKENPRRP